VSFPEVPSLTLGRQECSIFTSDDAFKAHLLQHDLRIALKLMERQNESQHADDLLPLEQGAIDYAKRHVVERIRRLMLVLVVDVRNEYVNDFGKESPAIRILDGIAEFSEAKWNSTIARCIYSLGDCGEFAERTGWVYHTRRAKSGSEPSFGIRDHLGIGGDR
jgi:hypothetical protein